MTPAEHAATVRDLETVRNLIEDEAITTDADVEALRRVLALAERATEPKVFRLEREARLAAEARAEQLERDYQREHDQVEAWSLRAEQLEAVVAAARVVNGNGVGEFDTRTTSTLLPLRAALAALDGGTATPEEKP